MKAIQADKTPSEPPSSSETNINDEVEQYIDDGYYKATNELHDDTVAKVAVATGAEYRPHKQSKANSIDNHLTNEKISTNTSYRTQHPQPSYTKIPTPKGSYDIYELTNWCNQDSMQWKINKDNTWIPMV